MSAAKRRQRGYFIVLDGPDGSGKSTQARLLSARLEEAGIRVLSVRDPGGTPVGERLREVLLDPGLPDMAPLTEMLLYMASRAELVARVVRPAIDSGVTVVSDRFISSTIVYQGCAGGIEPRDIVRVGKLACRGLRPDLVIILDLPAAEGFKRLRRAHDRMERKGAEFHKRVAAGFRRLARSDRRRHVLIDARGPVDAVADRVWKAVQRVVC
jgi:dTMP kinase